MWCKDCRQDVPALPAGDMQQLCCPRCGGGVCADSNKIGEEAAKSSSPAQSFAAYDGWDLDEQLRHIERVLQTIHLTDQDPKPPVRFETERLDRPHVVLPEWHQPESKQSAKRQKASGVKGGFVWGALAWMALVLGTAIFACGAAMLGWSLASGRQDLWTLGTSVALAGQIALVLGLLLQIERLWRVHHKASAKFDQFDERLHELKTATTYLSTSRSPTSTTFYSHFAEGASPKLLLTDLKSQIDLLAMKIAREER